MDNANSQDWRAYYERAHVFQRADALSVKVGLVLVPLFFGAGSIASFFYMPESLNLIIGWALIVTGFLVFLFLLFYAKRAKQKLPYALIGQLLKITEYGTKTHERSRLLKIKVHRAYELTPKGKGDELIGLEMSEVSKVYVLKHREAEKELLEPRGETVFICVPNGQVVAHTTNSKLTEYKY
jgi:cytochrome c biogenesis protein CcdA